MIHHANKCTNVFGARTQKTFVFSFSKRKKQIDFVMFLNRLRLRWKKVFLFVDNAKAHQGDIVRSFLRQYRKSFRLMYFPKYTPELNPTEQCWKPARKRVSNRLLKTIPAMKYHVKRVFEGKNWLPKMFDYLRD